MTLRPSPIPHTLYLTLIPIHKWLSRLIIIQSVIHTVLYLGYFQKRTRPKDFQTRKQLRLGSFVRICNYYDNFVILNEKTLVWGILLHALPLDMDNSCVSSISYQTKSSTFYTLANVSILVGQIAYRVCLTRVSNKGEVKVFDVSPNIAMIEFPNLLIAKTATAPGAHIRLTNYSSSFIVRAFKQLIQIIIHTP